MHDSGFAERGVAAESEKMVLPGKVLVTGVVNRGSSGFVMGMVAVGGVGRAGDVVLLMTTVKSSE